MKDALPNMKISAFFSVLGPGSLMTDLKRRSTDFATDMSLGAKAMSDSGYALGM